MRELIRPSPPPAWRDRVGLLVARTAGVHARLLAVAGAVLVVAGAGWWLLRAPSAAVEDRLPMAAGVATSPPTAVGTAPSATVTTDAGLVVQAAGAVVRPGVYRLEAGARVTDLLAAAGGALPEAQLDSVALAAKLVDGQRVYVPRVGETAPAAVVGGAGAVPAGTPTPASPLDLNSATAEQLDALPGIGPATAAAIVAHRDDHGPFRSVDGLLEVRGIGPAKLDQISDLVIV